MGSKDDDERRRKEKERRERDQRKTEKEKSKMELYYPGTTGEYKKARAKAHGISDKTKFVSEEAEASTRRYQTDNREADRLDALRETKLREHENRIEQRSPRRHERKAGYDREAHEDLVDITGRIANLDVSTARARRKSLYDRDDRHHESHQHPDKSSRNLHGEHGERAQKEARRSMRKADEHEHWATRSSTPSSRELYPHIADGSDRERNRVVLPSGQYYDTQPESGSAFSSPLSVDPRARSSTSHSSGREPRVNLAPPPPSNFRPFVRPEDRPPTDLSTAMTGGSGIRHNRNPDSWKPSGDFDVSDIARRTAASYPGESSDEDYDHARRLRRARDGKKRK